MSEDYTRTRADYNAPRKFRRKSMHVDFHETSQKKRTRSKQSRVIPSAQTVSLNIHANKQSKKSKQNQSSLFDYTQTEIAKNVLIVSNHPVLATKSLFTSYKTCESPTATTNSVLSKYEQMGKTSYKQHMRNVRRGGSTTTANTLSHDNIKDKMWSGYNKSMHPCRLRLKIKEKLLNNRMIKIVMYLGTLTRETKRRNQIKKLFRKTMRTILFQTRVNEIEQRLSKFYKNQASLQLKIQQPMLDLFLTGNNNNHSTNRNRKYRIINNNSAAAYRRHSIQLTNLTNSKLPLSKIRPLKGWIKHYSSDSSIFRLLNEKQLQTALNNIEFTIKHYRPGQRIFSQGSNATHFYIVLSGTVSIWAEKYDDSQLSSNVDLSNQDPYTVPQISKVKPNRYNTCTHEQASYTSMMQVFFQCFEKCQEIKTGETFGQLAFENNDKNYHSTAIAKDSCILAAIDKSDYEKYFRSLILTRQKETSNIFHHFKTCSKETFSLERCNLLKHVSETVSYDTADVIHGIRNSDDNSKDDHDIYIILQGSVCAYYFQQCKQPQQQQQIGNRISHTNSLYNRTTQLKNIVKKTPLLKLGKGELLDPRFVIEQGLKFRPNNDIDDETFVSNCTSKIENLYFMATSPVIILKINAQSFFRISRFDFWSIYHTCQSAIEIAMQRLDRQNQIENRLQTRHIENENGKKRSTTWQRRQKKWQRDENIDLFVKFEQSKENDGKLEQDSMSTHEKRLSNLIQESKKVKIPSIDTKLPRPLPVQRCTSTDLILMMH